ncbi:unnamed protein product [Didymodactylos carnosus]|uniref:Uncharacterized protein n=1 Tax=Didymodactylos carnosus TaxID=1234261 RepID=A0A813T397_9BILA|nr:unnamed protein product [Didymodactylos carnosus]CAF0899327.1 unnamed protein product [Didymodactylos carnosus]CAF3594529.1 unnamed protein product [Didymodactylos carnosus]CAF3680307.1 unnamed protein product [Didymodactylos carnosus]
MDKLKTNYVVDKYQTSKYNGDISLIRGKKEQSHCTLTVVKILDSGPKRDVGNDFEGEPVACESSDTVGYTKSFETNATHNGESSSISCLTPSKSSKLARTNTKAKVSSNKQSCTSSTSLTLTTKRSSTSPDPVLSTAKKQRTTMNSLSNVIIEPKKTLPSTANTSGGNNVAEAIVASSQEITPKNKNVSKSNLNNKISIPSTTVKQQKVKSCTIEDDTTKITNHKTKLTDQTKVDITDLPVIKPDPIQDEVKSTIKETSTTKKVSTKSSLSQQQTDKTLPQSVTTKLKVVSNDVLQQEIKNEVSLSPKPLVTSIEPADSIKKDEKKKEILNNTKKLSLINTSLSNKKHTTIEKKLDLDNNSTKISTTPIAKNTSVSNAIQSNDEKEKKPTEKSTTKNKLNLIKNSITTKSPLSTIAELNEMTIKRDNDNVDNVDNQLNIVQSPSIANSIKTPVKPLSSSLTGTVKVEALCSRAVVEIKNEPLSNTNATITVKSESSTTKDENISPRQSNQNSLLKKSSLNTIKSEQQNSPKLEQPVSKALSNLGKIPRKQPPQQPKKEYTPPRYRSPSPSFDSDKDYRRSSNSGRSNSRSSSYTNHGSSSKGKNGSSNYRSSPSRSRRYNDRERSRSRSRSRSRYHHSSSRRSFNDSSHRRNSKSDSYRNNSYQRTDESRTHHSRRTKSKSPYRYQHQEDIKIKEETQTKIETTSSSPTLLSISPFNHPITPESQPPPRSVEQTYLTSPEEQHIFRSEDDCKVIEMDIDDDNNNNNNNDTNNNSIIQKTVSCTFIKAETAPIPLTNGHLHSSDDGEIDSDEQVEEELDDDNDDFPSVLTDESLRTKIAFIYNLFSCDTNHDAILEKFVHFFKRSGLVDITKDDHMFTYDLLKLTPVLINQLADDLGYVKQ